jgi:hypothetical protein
VGLGSGSSVRLADNAPIPIGVGIGVGLGVGNPPMGVDVGVGVGVGLPWAAGGSVPLIVVLSGLTHPLICSMDIAAKTKASARVASAETTAILQHVVKYAG